MTQHELNNALIEKSKVLHEMILNLQTQVNISMEAIENIKVLSDSLMKINDGQAKMNDNFNSRLEALEKLAQ